ncbi:MAG TPA: C4-type zinc ribbon domain-containing protein [Planctomycetota bacterium]
MRQTLRILRGLQELDRDLYRLQDELRRFPQEVTRKREKLRSESERLAEAEKKLLESKVRLKEIEDLTTGQRQRVRKLEHEAGEARADAALLVAFQHEIRTLKRDIGEAEEEGLGLVSEIERLTAEREALRAAVSEQEKEFEQYASSVDREARQTMDRAQALEKKRRERGSTELSPHVLGQYEKLLASREGQAMAELDGRVCQGCYVSVPNNIYVRLARFTELVPCPSCGRILYLRDD